ncbi:hypothetical protein M427DRAFT_384267 [Gonapodya prolifera JEL478]|uniref:Uncharacterized protein n=1 Tax=Gonapodya prolifera (strain JEL478) TaxID=1344416 RepID=A0A139A8U3_GONPJ|nr:hypothetical protein M427DRAFT_384267 [Gonapodya prolifera JEL478]|eukprot:KXS13222.1 hypothetical protein M427DRAFT_384267 [Gonapodya prolifera JEL478]
MLVPDGESGKLVLSPIPTTRFFDIVPHHPTLSTAKDVANAGRHAKRKVVGARATIEEASKETKRLHGKLYVAGARGDDARVHRSTGAGVGAADGEQRRRKRTRPRRGRVQRR